MFWRPLWTKFAARSLEILKVCIYQIEQRPPLSKYEAFAEVQKTAVPQVTTRGWLQKHQKPHTHPLKKENFTAEINAYSQTKKKKVKLFFYENTFDRKV